MAQWTLAIKRYIVTTRRLPAPANIRIHSSILSRPPPKCLWKPSTSSSLPSANLSGQPTLITVPAQSTVSSCKMEQVKGSYLLSPCLWLVKTAVVSMMVSSDARLALEGHLWQRSMPRISVRLATRRRRRCRRRVITTCTAITRQWMGIGCTRKWATAIKISLHSCSMDTTSSSSHSSTSMVLPITSPSRQ